MDKTVDKSKQGATTRAAAARSAGKSTAAKKAARAAREPALTPFQQMEKQWRDSEKFFAGFFPGGWLQPFHMFMSEWPQFKSYELPSAENWFAMWWPNPQQWGMPEWPFAIQDPRMDLIIQDDAYVIRADIPGVREADVEVSFSGDSMTLRGKTGQEKDETAGGYHRHETLRGSFSRTMTLPGPIDSGNATTTLTDGMLEVVVPKAG